VAHGNRAEHDAGVEDVVVVREVTGGDLVDPGAFEGAPGGGAQVGGGRVEGVGGDAALPVALDGLLQFPVPALAGVAVQGCRGCGLRGHGDLLHETIP